MGWVTMRPGCEGRLLAPQNVHLHDPRLLLGLVVSDELLTLLGGCRRHLRNRRREGSTEPWLGLQGGGKLISEAHLLLQGLHKGRQVARAHLQLVRSLPVSSLFEEFDGGLSEDLSHYRIP